MFEIKALTRLSQRKIPSTINSQLCPNKQMETKYLLRDPGKPVLPQVEQ